MVGLQLYTIRNTISDRSSAEEEKLWQIYDSLLNLNGQAKTSVRFPLILPVP